MEREVLSEKIKSVFHEHKGHYGAVRITKSLHNSGIFTNTKRVGKLMHLMGLYAKGSRYKYKDYNRKGASLSRSNLINQIFKATAPNKVWLGDMAYIPNKEGTLYLAVNIDVFSRKIVGWSMSSRMQDKLVMDCFLQACGKEHPYDNAMMESFYKTLKRELINVAHFETRTELLKKFLNILRTITIQKGCIQLLITSLQKTLKNIILKFS